MKPPRARRVPDDRLPVYSIIVALYREAHSVEELVRALRQLDYPPEKLQILLVTEPDDLETLAALSRLDLDTPFEIITAPANGPRTKPKALNAALAFARGTLTVIYDAEDRPEPDQLRHAVEMFRIESADVACVQARLTIDNTADSWLARVFTAEYASQFDLFLPGLAALRLPLPLGGSSNHFPTAVLRQIGAWDSYNVTEDADLGMRLARFGYRSTVLHSTTYEEAPAHFGAWLKQRTRWFKGWMQTWSVHMRSPPPPVQRARSGGISDLSARRRRQRAGGPDPSDLPRQPALCARGRNTDPVHRRRWGRPAHVAVLDHARRRISDHHRAGSARLGAP
jgi:glycosyltransferase XagB